MRQQFTFAAAAVLFGLGATVIGGGFRTYFLGREINQNDWQGRLALERMTRELRTVRTATAADLNIGVAGQITFNDFGGNSIVYRQTGNTIERSQNAGAFQPLADNVSAASPLSFTYLLLDGVTATGVSANVYFIRVSFTVSSANASATYRGAVKPTSF